MRQAMKTGVAVVASLLALGAAGGAHYLYSTERFAPVADGQWVADAQGFTWRLDGWTATTPAADPSGFWHLTPGAVVVNVSVSVRAPADPPARNGCAVRLVGRDQAQWTPILGEGDSPMTICGDAGKSADKTADGVVQFEVPAVWATPDRILGVAFARASGFAPAPLLTTTRAG